MGAHNNPNGNWQPLDADRKGGGEDIQNASWNTDPYITTVCAVCRKKDRNLTICLRYKTCVGLNVLRKYNWCYFHTPGIEPINTVMSSDSKCYSPTDSNVPFFILSTNNLQIVRVNRVVDLVTPSGLGDGGLVVRILVGIRDFSLLRSVLTSSCGPHIFLFSGY